MQEPPNTAAAVPPEGKEVHWNRPAGKRRVALPSSSDGRATLRPITASTDKISATILIIGDIPDNLDFAHAALQSCGYEVILAGSVNKAVALTEETQPDAVLSELHMRPLDGVDLLEIAKKTPALRGVPIVIISSTCAPELERRNCLEHGAARFVRRPIPPEALLAEIAEALNASRRGADHENPNC